MFNNNALNIISNNFLDYLSRAVSNNILQTFINNNQNQPNSLQTNKKQDHVDNHNSRDIFNYKKKSKKEYKGFSEDINILFDKEKNNQYQISLNKRKDNINNFLLNYRLKNLNSNQYKVDEKKPKILDFPKKERKELNNESGLNDKKIKENKDDKKDDENKPIKSDLKENNKDKTQNNKNIKIIEKNNFNKNLLNDNLISDQEIFSKPNNDNNYKEELKKIFLEEIFYQKSTANNYEISSEYFNEIIMPPYGNCFYCCLSYFLYKTYNNHMQIRSLIYQYITNNQEEFYIYFKGNDNENLDKYSPQILLEDYVEKNNKDGEYAGDIEYTVACKIFNIRIILLIKGYHGFNVFNLYSDEKGDSKNNTNIYILFINKNHFNYLEVQNYNDLEEEELNLTISNSLEKNLLEWEKIRKKEYPLSLKWYPEIYREMYYFFKYDITPEERFNKTTNPSQYIKRFKDLAKKSFYYNSDRLYFIKSCNCKRLPNGEFEDINKVIMKKIPFTYEILPKLEELHNINGHISYRTLSKKFLEDEYFIDNIELITKEYATQCPECYAKFFSRKIIKSPKIIYDEGPHYRLLIDITYLDKKYYSNKTNYKYIIDCIDHFSKFYWGYLIRDKTANTTLTKIKNFIGINKKPVIVQTDNGLEFKNKSVENFFKDEGIKHIFSRPHHPQTNGCLERYHRELHKFMKNFLKEKKNFEDKDLEEALDEYIRFHNNSKKSSTKYTPNEIRDLDDEDLINNILKNILKSFKKHKINKNELLDPNEKLLLWNNLEYNNEIYRKSDKVKSGEFLYPCIFKEIVNSETIKIYFAEKMVNFEKNKDYKVNIESLIIVPEFVYNYYLIKINKNQPILPNIYLEEENEISSDSEDYMEYKSILNESDKDSDDNSQKDKNKKKTKKEVIEKKINDSDFLSRKEEKITYPKNRKKNK